MPNAMCGAPPETNPRGLPDYYFTFTIFFCSHTRRNADKMISPEMPGLVGKLLWAFYRTHEMGRMNEFHISAVTLFVLLFVRITFVSHFHWEEKLKSISGELLQMKPSTTILYTLMCLGLIVRFALSTSCHNDFMVSDACKICCRMEFNFVQREDRRMHRR